MRILGVNDGINGSVALVEDGKLRYVLQEERFSGVKEHVGFPYKAVEKVLKLADLHPTDIDEMALATKYVTFSPGVEGHTKSMSVQQKLKDIAPAFFGLYEDNVPVIKERVPWLFQHFEKTRQVRRLSQIRAKSHYWGPITVIDHHIAHAAAAYYCSPWRDDVLVMSKDASGDGLCATVNIGQNGTFRRIARTVHTNSLGYLYTGVTGFMGFKQHSHEFKLTGLAPHAPEKSVQKPYEVFKSYIDVEGLEFRRKIPEPLHHVKPRLKDDLYMMRFDAVAAGLQRLTEELMVQWVAKAIERTKLSKVVAGGGVFMNVKVNKLIREKSYVDGFFPMPSAGDESTAIGAAQWLYAERMREAGQEPKVEPLGPLYLGDEATDREIEDAIAMEDNVREMVRSSDIEQAPFDVQHSSQVDDLAADLIIKGGIVARCRGPMEWGARALGNRSILCDATDLRNVGIINRMIKSRDFWMPFAPVIMEARADELMKRPAYAPYMTIAFDTTDAGRECLRAAMHQADFTVRPQILREKWNPSYYRILHSYEMETGHGGMLNTSFNLHGEPNVRSPKQALHTFFNSGLKHMVLGDYLLSKK